MGIWFAPQLQVNFSSPVLVYQVSLMYISFLGDSYSVGNFSGELHSYIVQRREVTWNSMRRYFWPLSCGKYCLGLCCKTQILWSRSQISDAMKRQNEFLSVSFSLSGTSDTRADRKEVCSKEKLMNGLSWVTWESNWLVRKAKLNVRTTACQRRWVF